MTDTTQELDDILSQAFTDGASDTMWQDDRHVEIFATAKKALLDWHNKQVLEIIGKDQSQKRPDGSKNTAEWTNGRNNLRQQQRNKLKEKVR